VPDADQMMVVDVDDTVKPTYGYGKQGAGYGYTHVKVLNALIGTLSTPMAAPVNSATRLWKGSTSSARGAASFVASTLSTAKRCGGSGRVLARMDSAFYTADVVAATGRAGTKFSITARQTVSVKAAIAAIADDAWIPIHYPNAVWDDQAGRWVSDAEVAETSYTAFASRGMGRSVTARLIVRRVKLLPPAGADQPALVEGYRYHAVFTDSPLTMLQAETCHRGHAIVEQVIADLKNGPLAHLPSGKFAANAAWLALAASAQPDPGRRRLSLGVPRHRPTGHHPPPADQPAGPDRHLGPTAHPAPADRLAMGTSLASPHRRDHLNRQPADRRQPEDL
jgi:Transposase DDE domain group 1